MHKRFWFVLALICAAYLAFWGAMLVATATYTTPKDVLDVLLSRDIRFAAMLSLTTCTITAVLSVGIAVPVGYLMARTRFRGHSIIDAALDIPIVLPPMVVGICLLIFFQSRLGGLIESVVPFTYQRAGVVLAQFVIAAAFAIRSMRGVFDHLSARPEDVAMTLGCTRWQALWHVTLPASRRGIFASASIAWARSLGEFGPVLVFGGATRGKTEVLATSVWLYMSVGDLEQAVAVSLLMIVVSMIVLVAIRVAGERV